MSPETSTRLTDRECAVTLSNRSEGDTEIETHVDETNLPSSAAADTYRVSSLLNDEAGQPRAKSDL